HDLLVRPLRPGGFAPLSFRWDEDTGTVVGRDAERVREFVRIAQASGEVAIELHPRAHSLSADPLRSRADLAAIFARYFILPGVLADALPVGDSGAEPGDGVGVVH